MLLYQLYTNIVFRANLGQPPPFRKVHLGYIIGRAKGYEDYEAQLFVQSFTHDILGGKYKPVARKVIPISTYDPDTVIHAFGT